MRKSILSLLTVLTVLFLIGCSKDSDPVVSPYTESQEKALSVFNGTWADIQFSNLGSYPGSNLQPNPDKIIFGSKNSKPEEVYKDDFIEGQKLLFSSFGELVYHNEGYEDVACYYWVSKNADELRLYSKESKVLYKAFSLKFECGAKMFLHDRNLTLPYIFVKQ